MTETLTSLASSIRVVLDLPRVTAYRGGKVGHVVINMHTDGSQVACHQYDYQFCIRSDRRIGPGDWKNEPTFRYSRPDEPTCQKCVRAIERHYGKGAIAG